MWDASRNTTEVFCRLRIFILDTTYFLREQARHDKKSLKEQGSNTTVGKIIDENSSIVNS